MFDSWQSCGSTWLGSLAVHLFHVVLWEMLIILNCRLKERGAQRISKILQKLFYLVKKPFGLRRFFNTVQFLLGGGLKDNVVRLSVRSVRYMSAHS